MDLRAVARKSPRAPGQVLECGWCGGPVIVQVRGRMPKWCSSTCRTRASERRRAAADGLAAVKVVERDIERIKTVTVVQHHTRQGGVPAAYFARLTLLPTPVALASLRSSLVRGTSRPAGSMTGTWKTWPELSTNLWAQWSGEASTAERAAPLARCTKPLS